MDKIKIAYIGGGSKMWARIFMNDLALCGEMNGDIFLYDIDQEAAKRNQAIGERINQNSQTLSKWNYYVADSIEECLSNATFVVMSIMPGGFDEMMVDVHLPEKYGIYQTVGDTVGPGGVLRAMRTVPIYEDYAKQIEAYAPNAWVINFTNPMSICIKTLYDVFPKIKAFGCCHEVFHAQEFLALVAKEEMNLKTRPTRKEIAIDVSGINHFTWISSAKYQGIELLPLITNFSKRHFEEGIYHCDNPSEFKNNTYAYGNKVKMDLYLRYKVLGAAGDRHLVEFVNNTWYLKNPEVIKNWAMGITTVQSRIEKMYEKIDKSIRLAKGLEEVTINQSKEEAIDLMKAVLGIKDIVSNVNAPNMGQIDWLPKNSIVESNCLFTKDSIKPLHASSLPIEVQNLIIRNSYNIDTLYEGIKKRDLAVIFSSFINQPLCSTISLDEGKALFKEMLLATRKYLDQYFSIDAFLKNF